MTRSMAFHLPAFAIDAPAFNGAPGTPRLGLCESGGENGEDLVAATLLALDDAGVSAQILPGDDGRDPIQARAVATALCAAGVNAVIGHFGSTTALPASRIYGAGAVPFLAPGTSSPNLCTAEALTTLQLFGTDDEQLACLYAASSDPSVLILGEIRNCGAGLAERLFLRRSGGSRQARVLYLPRGQEIVPAGALRGVGAIYVLGSREFAAGVCRRPAVIASRLPILLSDDSFSPSLFLDRHLSRGQVAFLYETGDLLVDRHSDAMRGRGAHLLGRLPGPYFETSYVAARAIAAAWGATGSTDRAAVLGFIRARRWSSPYGLLGFDGCGRLSGHRWTMVSAAAMRRRAGLDEDALRPVPGPLDTASIPA
jgi:branched-chain amino acid transport system substrate-binding protein